MRSIDSRTELRFGISFVDGSIQFKSNLGKEEQKHNSFAELVVPLRFCGLKKVVRRLICFQFFRGVYSSEAICKIVDREASEPHRVEGIDRCDRDKSTSTKDQLRSFD